MGIPITVKSIVCSILDGTYKYMPHDSVRRIIAMHYRWSYDSRENLLWDERSNFIGAKLDTANNPVFLYVKDDTLPVFPNEISGIALNLSIRLIMSQYKKNILPSSFECLRDLHQNEDMWYRHGFTIYWAYFDKALFEWKLDKEEIKDENSGLFIYGDGNNYYVQAKEPKENSPYHVLMQKNWGPKFAKGTIYGEAYKHGEADFQANKQKIVQYPNDFPLKNVKNSKIIYKEGYEHGYDGHTGVGSCECYNS